MTMANILRVSRYLIGFMPGIWIPGRCLPQVLLPAVEVAILIQRFIRGKLARIHADKMRKAILIQRFNRGKLAHIHADKMRKEAKLRKEGGIEGSHHES